jgi:septum formation protein
VSKIILASSSVTRQQMLENAGVEFDVLAARIDEEEIRQSLLAEGAGSDVLADALAERKATYVARHRPDELVVGADQILECGGRIFSKPADRKGAKQQLMDLRGKDHDLVSCVCVVRGSQRLWHHLDRTHLKMRNFSDEFLDQYLDAVGDTALEGPGAYRIEGLGSQLFSRITGDYFTILGLPLLPLLEYLRVQGELNT